MQRKRPAGNSATIFVPVVGLVIVIASCGVDDRKVATNGATDQGSFGGDEELSEQPSGTEQDTAPTADGPLATPQSAASPPPPPPPVSGDVTPIQGAGEAAQGVGSGDSCAANPCPTQMQCAPDGSGYRCECPSGYSANGSDCVDIDECALNNGGCQQACANTAGGVSCSCIDGYEPVNGDPTRCVGSAGAQCESAAQCASGACVDGACCSVSACGPCQHCSAASGACESVTNADDPDTCTGERTCDSGGTCKLRNGRTCGAAEDCISQFCRDGLCCDTACNGVCNSCARQGSFGVCSAVSSGADPDTCGGADVTCGSRATCLRSDRVVPGPGVPLTSISGSTGGKLAQVITPTTSAQLAELRFSSYYAGVDVITVSIQGLAADGSPSGNRMASAVADTSTEASSVVFEPAVTIRAGTPFAVVFESTGDYTVPMIDEGNIYGGGSLFYTTSAPALQWVAYEDWDIPLEALYLR